MVTYKNLMVNPHNFSLLGEHHFLACHPTAPSLSIFHWKKDQAFYTCPVSEKLSSITSTSDGVYVIGGGTSGKIFIWEAAGGALVKVWDAHYRRIVCIKLTDGDDLIVTAGEDSVVKVWNLCSVLSEEKTNPLYSWANHSLPITDLHCGYGGVKGLIVSSSLDRTCRVWSLTLGTELGNSIFPVSIVCVTLDPTDSFLYAGGLDGSLFFVPIGNFLAGAKTSVVNLQQTIKAHDKKINCLQVSKEGALLLSASDDGLVKTWDLSSQQLVRVFNLHQGPVTNLVLLPLPRILTFEKETKDKTEVVRPLKKFTAENNANTIEWFNSDLQLVKDGEDLTLDNNRELKKALEYLAILRERGSLDQTEEEESELSREKKTNNDLRDQISHLQEEVSRLKKLANKIYASK